MPTYATGAPTMEEIICLYLYDDIVPPKAGTLKTKADVLALAQNTRQDVEIDKQWFMTQGGGRFMHIARFRIVRNFLGKKDHEYIHRSLQVPPKGTIMIYSPRQLLAAYNKQPSDRFFGLKQYEYGINDTDFTDRCEVFGSCTFEINQGAQFVIKDDGSREIRNIWVELVNDDYDYKSNSWEAKISNFLTEGEVDPWKIGRRVEIKFTGSISHIDFFSERDLRNL